MIEAVAWAAALGIAAGAMVAWALVLDARATRKRRELLLEVDRLARSFNDLRSSFNDLRSSFNDMRDVLAAVGATAIDVMGAITTIMRDDYEAQRPGESPVEWYHRVAASRRVRGGRDGARR